MLLLLHVLTVDSINNASLHANNVIILKQASKARINNHKEELVSCKRAATGCMRVCRLRAMQSQKAMKEIVWRAKRLTREMQAYWKRYDRVEKVKLASNETI